MKIRPRLLIGSLIVAAVLAVVIGWAISRGGTSKADDVVTVGPTSPLDQPTIGTNAKVTGSKLADAYVRTASGDKLQTSDLLGEPLVINYWSSTCTPCKKELPDFVTAHGEFGDRVRFVGIDSLPSLPSEIKFAQDLGVDYEIYYDGDGKFSTALGLSNQPVTLFVRPDGTIAAQTGEIDLATIRANVIELLG